MKSLSYFIEIEENQEEFYAWASQLQHDSLKLLLQAIFRMFGMKQDPSRADEVISKLKSLLADDRHRMIPTEAILESCRFQERDILREKYEQQINEIQSIHARDIGTYKDSLATLTTAKLLLEQEKANMMENMQMIVMKEASRISEEKEQRCIELEKEILRLQASAQAELHAQERKIKDSYSLWREKELENLNKLALPSISQLQTQVGDFRLDIGSIQQSLGSLNMSVDQFKTPLNKMQNYVEKYDSENASLKGRLMEDKYFMMLTRALPEYEVTLSRDSSHDMDIQIVKEELIRPKILIDIKNYTQNVSGKEIRKFHSDILTNASSGILISATTGIATKKHMQIDIIDGKYVALYLTNVGSDTSQVVNGLSVIHGIDRFLAQQDNKTQIDPIALEKVTESLNTLNNVISDLKDNNEKQRRLLLKFQLDNILQILQGGSVEKNRNVINIEDSNDKVRKFVESHITASEDTNDFFTLKSVAEAWEVSECMKNQTCPNSSILKAALECHLKVACLKQKSYHGITKYGVFTGFKIVSTKQNTSSRVHCDKIVI